ncbi:MAG: UDP-3-O-acyl-N-acetylglucosamine deacetylase [Rhodospirillales bacterium]|nr:UDP-3-O-acyl-N-acetylglucosamine deacetylase [Rhodospirillales bacterium]
MDGFTALLSAETPPLHALQGWLAGIGMQTSQQTLKTAIDCAGTGLHSGRMVRLALHPAPVDHGIVFLRSDLGLRIPARYDAVGDTRLCTVIGEAAGRIGTIEHLMAALSGLGIDNALIAVDGPELPVFDGSAEPFVFLIERAGIAVQDAPRRMLAIRQSVRVEDGAAFAELHPAEADAPAGLSLAMSIDFAAPAIGRQHDSLHLSPVRFRRDIAAARTFALAGDIDALRASGLALGGSLDNAIVVDGARVLNPGGLRMEREFVRHKLLDAVGDLALAGAPIHGRFVCHRGGHALTNRLLHAVAAADAASLIDARLLAGETSQARAA